MNKHAPIVKKIMLPAILLMAFLAHLPTFQNGFTESWDSENAPYIKGNPLITDLSGESVLKMFSVQYDGHYHPLTMLSLALDYKLGGLEPFQYHLTSMFLHLLNTAALYFLVGCLFNNPLISVVSAALFGVHPLHVESISWLSERKNLLYSTFFLLSLISYVKFLAAPETEKRGRRTLYTLSVLFFLLSLLSKSQAVVLPVILITIHILKRGRFHRRIIPDKIPFFVIAGLFGVLARKAQEEAWALQESSFSFFERSVFACYSYIQYILKILVPVNLSAKYLYPERIDGHIPYKYFLYIIPAAIVIAVTVYSIKKSKPAAFALLFFSINIFFLLKQFKVPYGDYIMADRYTYMPSIGIFLLGGIALNKIKGSAEKPVYIGLALYVLTLSVMTCERTRIWKNDLTFYDALRNSSPTYSEGWFIVALIKERSGLYAEAVDLYDRYAAIKPENGVTYYNRGVVKSSRLNDQEGALRDYSTALSKNLEDPIKFAVYYQRSLAYFINGSYDKALMDIKRASDILLTLKKREPHYKQETDLLERKILDKLKKTI